MQPQKEDTQSTCECIGCSQRRERLELGGLYKNCPCCGCRRHWSEIFRKGKCVTCAGHLTDIGVDERNDWLSHVAPTKKEAEMRALEEKIFVPQISNELWKPTQAHRYYGFLSAHGIFFLPSEAEERPAQISTKCLTILPTDKPRGKIFIGHVSCSFNAGMVTAILNTLVQHETVIQLDSSRNRSCWFVELLAEDTAELCSKTKWVLCEPSGAWLAASEAEAQLLADAAMRPKFPLQTVLHWTSTPGTMGIGLPRQSMVIEPKTSFLSTRPKKYSNEPPRNEMPLFQSICACRKQESDVMLSFETECTHCHQELCIGTVVRLCLTCARAPVHCLKCIQHRFCL